MSLNNILEMQYVLLPVIDTSHRFLYRFTKPEVTIWIENKIRMIDFVSMKMTLEECLKDFALNEWEAMAIPIRVDEVKIKECDIVEL